MAEGKQELGWDLSNSIMAAVVNSGAELQRVVIQSSSGKRAKPVKHLEFSKLNPFRY